MKKKVALVTGAGGFIGSHLVEELLIKNFYVKAFLKYNSNSNLGWLKNIKSKKNLEIIYGDVRDFDSINKAIRDGGIARIDVEVQRGPVNIVPDPSTGTQGSN